MAEHNVRSYEKKNKYTKITKKATMENLKRQAIYLENLSILSIKGGDEDTDPNEPDVPPDEG